MRESRLVRGKRLVVMYVIVLAALLFAAVSSPVFGQDRPITLEVSTWWLVEAGLGETFLEAGEAYMEQNPNVAIEFIQVAYNEYVDKMVVGAIAGESPDVMFVDQWWTADLIVNDIPMNLEMLIARDNIDLSEFIEAPLRAHQAWWSDSTTYGLPVLASPFSLIAHPSNFLEAGLPKPDIGWDTDTFWESARKLTVDRDGDGEPDKWALGGQHHFWNHMIINFGGEYISEDGRTLVFNSPKAIAGMEFLRELQNSVRGINLETIPGYGIGMHSFFVGDAAIGRGPLNPDHSYWLLSFPGNERQLQEVLTHGFMISENTAYPEEAWDFVKWMTMGEGAVIFARSGQNPARMDSYLWNEWLETDLGFDFQDIGGLLPGIGDGTNTQPTIPGWQSIYGELGGVVEQALLDPTVDLRGVIESRMPAWQSRIDEFWEAYERSR